MKITLHKNQGTVFRSISRFKVVVAGRRFGKTILACVMLFINCLKTKDGLFWYVSPTYKQTKQIAWKILLRLIPSEVLAKKPNETDLCFVFKNGAELHLKGADNPDGLRGTGLNGLVIDEFASIRNAQSVWQEVLRPALTDKKGWCLFIGTPKGKNAFWELWLKGQKKEDGYESWQFKTADNPFIDQNEIDEARKTLNERYFRQEYEASFEDYTGLIWSEFTEKHILDQIDIKPWWESIGAIDTAISGTTAALRGVIDERGTVYIVDEFYDQNKRVSEVSESIIGWKPSLWLIDPASKAKNQRSYNGNTFSLFDEYSDNGIVAISAENDVFAGINRVGEYFKANRLFIVRSCTKLIFELERYHWSEARETVNGITTPKPYKHLDHACDALRYLIMGRPNKPDEPKERPEGSKPMTVENMEAMEKQQHQDEEYA